MSLNIGISGKRYFKEKAITLETELISTIALIQKKTKVESFTGFTMIAAGADAIFAKVVLNHFKQPIKVVLPFPKHEYEKDFNDKELEVFHNIIERASEVIILSDVVPSNPKERSKAYQKAGLEIAAQSTQMIFVWDEIKPSGLGGTADILSIFAADRPVDQLNLIKVLPRKSEGLQYRILNALYKDNQNAMRNKKLHDKVWKRGLFWGWFAVLTFAINTGFDFIPMVAWGMSATEIISLTILAVIIIHGKRKAFHKNFLRQRIRVEQLRLLNAFVNIGTNVQVKILVEDNDLELIGFMREINASKQETDFNNVLYSNFIIKDLISSQQDYHKNKIASIGHTPQILEKINTIIAMLFFLNVSIHFAFATGHTFHVFGEPEWLKSLGTTLSIILPGSYAATEGILFFEDWEKIKKQSENVYAGLDSCAENVPQKPLQLDQITCSDSQVILIKDIASRMVNENLSWQIIFEEKSNYHWVI